MHKYDFDLGRRDIQQLSNAEEVTAFFARLGYSTDVQIEQTVDNLGITSDGAKRPVNKIWLISDEQTFLQVYLFELKTVSMTSVRELSRAFRNKAGNYLFILTSGYDKLDFVLIERIVPNGDSGLIGTRHSGVRPRIITVDRRDPGLVAIRVLRRFTYTESDPFYQYEKLLSAYSIAEWSEEYFNNRALFSDYFLINRLPTRPEWREDPKPAYKKLREICKDNVSEYISERESGIRLNLFEPVFKELGFQMKAGKGAADPSYGQPDYYLYSTNHNHKDHKPIAVALIYPWGRSLDGKDDQRDKDTPEENPGAAVISLLEADKAPWAIVTNGRIWRLYSQKTHSRATNYYEIDLTEALSLGSPAHTDPALAFRYYWLFFRSEAFEKKKKIHEGRELEHSFLDQVLLGSEEYAKELGERLKERIFDRIFQNLAEGFIADIRSKEGKDIELHQDRLDSIFHGTLTLLYRLLFLLYSESRDLLPAREERGYFEASLKKLKEEIAQNAGKIEDDSHEKLSRHYPLDEYTLYQRLMHLFEIVDTGNERLNVPVYNGGLFMTIPADDDNSAEAVNARFIRDHAVPDRYLAQAIDLLARDVDDKRQDLVFIDYKSLGVRQLGSMYEGLLEFRLRIAPEKMAIVRGKKTEEILPYKEAKAKNHKILTDGRGKIAKERTIPKGTVYLENDKRERKATGSYYTPEHIVKYIIEHAVGPVLKEKLELFRPKLREVERKRKAFEDRQKALIKGGLKPESEEKKKLIGRELVDELFNIRVLDPAMGSGHFLVHAVDYITDSMLDFLNSFPVNPVRDFLEKTRVTILKEMDDQGITIDASRLTDVNLLKRHVLKRCIYGVDLNPMAVELAKVSLWLDCFTLGAPLSFLDHHLRCGNSLIGVTVEEVREAIEGGQQSLFGTRFTGLKMAIGLMREIGELPDVTSKDVSESRRKYKKATVELVPFKRILDMYTSRWFGNETYSSGKGAKKRVHDPAKEFLRSQEVEAWYQDPEGAKLSEWGRKVAETAARAAAKKRFFHWELEFPEVFYGPKPGTERYIDRLEGAGFDAVVGNPPYDVLAEKELGYVISDEIEYYKSNAIFYPSIKGKNNLYKLFVCRGLDIASNDGLFSFITPMALLGDSHSSEVRRVLLEQSGLINIEVFPQKDDPRRRIFFEAKLSTAVFVARKSIVGNKFIIRLHPGKDINIFSGEVIVSPDMILLFDDENHTIPCCQKKDWDIVAKLLKLPNTKYIRDYCKAYQGEINETTDSKLGLVSKNPKDGPQILRGSAITLYILRDQSQGENIYLKRDKYLAKKKDSEKAKHHKYDRVGWQESSAQNNFRRIISAKIPKGEFCNHKINYIPENECDLPLEMLLILLNSNISDWYFRLGSTNNAVSHYQIYNLIAPSVQKVEINNNFKSLLENEDWEGLLISLKNACDGSGIMPIQVMDSLISLCKRIMIIEQKRKIRNRSDRSNLDNESQRLQNIIDEVLFHCYGMNNEEAMYINNRLKEML